MNRSKQGTAILIGLALLATDVPSTGAETRRPSVLAAQAAIRSAASEPELAISNGGVDANCMSDQSAGSSDTDELLAKAAQGDGSAVEPGRLREDG